MISEREICFEVVLVSHYNPIVMKFFKKISSIILFIFIIIGLNQIISAQQTVRFTLNDFPINKELIGEKVNLKKPLKNPHELLLIDSLLIVRNINCSPAFDIFNLNTGELKSQFCLRGRGPGELIAPFSFQFIEETNEIMVQDIQGKKLVFFDLDSILLNAPKKFTKTISLDKDVLVRKIKQVKGGDFFCDLIGHKDSYMNCLLNKEGDLIRLLEKYPKTNIPYNPLLGSNLFGVNIGVSQGNKVIILPYIYSDKIDIYDYKGNFITEFVGPNYKNLDITQGVNGATITSRNKLAFNIPQANCDLFLVPYSGTKYRYSSTSANHILSFDFTGKLLQRFIVSPSVTEIAIDWEKKIIYSVNKELEPTLYKYKF
jgi:hypothetical protein